MDDVWSYLGGFVFGAAFWAWAYYVGRRDAIRDATGIATAIGDAVRNRRPTPPAEGGE